MIKISDVSVPLDYDYTLLVKLAAKAAGIAPESITKLEISAYPQFAAISPEPYATF